MKEVALKDLPEKFYIGTMKDGWFNHSEHTAHGDQLPEKYWTEYIKKGCTHFCRQEIASGKQRGLNKWIFMKKTEEIND